MRNLSDTQSYTFFDHVTSRAIWSLSRLIGVKRIMTPFWNRWRASIIGEDTLREFLSNIQTMEDWPVAAKAILDREADNLERIELKISDAEHIERLRRLSFLAHLAQWGTIPIDDLKRDAYRKSRDYYFKAETLAFGARYRRLAVPWAGRTVWGNLHIAETGAVASPLVLIIHGMDDTKEEHLSTELILTEAGLSVLTMDGPGQGEALLLDGITWPTNFEDMVPLALSALASDSRIDVGRAALVGISWGGFWIYKAASVEGRVKALLDLGGPIDAARFQGVPFFLKSKFCQTMGVSGPEDLGPREMRAFSLRNDDTLSRILCAVRIIHGGKDPLVPVSDKEWLLNTLKKLHVDGDYSMRVFPTGDHCCTAQAEEVRADAIAFFRRTMPFPE
jgi:pimeloyl-ACP methyl ester carboxylesterase